MKKKLLKKILLLLWIPAIFISGCSKDEDSVSLTKEEITINLNQEINADTIESIVTWMENMGTRFALADNHRLVALKIMKRLKMMGYEDTRLDSFLLNKTYRDIIYNQWQYNVIASIRGTDFPDSVSVIGAHYDDNLKTGDVFSIVPGANDNASGVALMLEIARVMKKNKYSPKGTIEFVAFGAEELGLYGSTAYASAAKKNSKKIKMMLNNDMVAFQPGTDKSDWTVNILDYENSHTLRMDAETMCSRYSILRYRNDNSANKQSDSFPFFNNGFKAIFFFSDYIDPDYHSTNDLAANCNFDYCSEIGRVCCALLVDKN